MHTCCELECVFKNVTLGNRPRSGLQKLVLTKLHQCYEQHDMQLPRPRTFRTLRTVANIAYTAGCFLKCNSITKYSYIQAESRFLTVLHLLFTVWMF